MTEIGHGYTLRDIDQMTSAAAIADRSLAMDYATRRDIAWSAIAEALVTAEEPPIRQDLIRAGWQAIYREARAIRRGRGMPDTAYKHDEYAPRARFALYWEDLQVTPSPERRIVEGIAVHQVLARLNDTHRDAIIALAVMDDYAKAADMLGITYQAMKARISVARRQLLALWHEGETPHLSQHRTDRRVGSYSAERATHCSNGHEWTPENTRTRHRTLRGKRHTSRVCKKCESDRSAKRWQAQKDRAA